MSKQDIDKCVEKLETVIKKEYAAGVKWSIKDGLKVDPKPHLVQKVMAAAIKKGYKISPYLDDIYVFEKSFWEKHQTLEKILLIIIGATFGLTSNLVISRSTKQSQHQLDNRQDSIIKGVDASLKILQKQIGDSLP